MTTLQDYSDRVQELIHDLNLIDFTQPRLTAKINQARVRAALDLKCCRVFFDNLNLIPNRERYPVTGGVAGAKLLFGGRNYVSPKVVFVGGSGQGAAATATAVGGVVTSITITDWGFGYNDATPALNIIDGAGWVSNFQVRSALAALTVPSTSSALVYNAILALPVGDPVNIQWNSGAPTIAGDGLYLLIMSALAFSGPQMAVLYANAALFSDPFQATPTGLNAASPQGQTLVSSFVVTNQQLRLALADPTMGLMTQMFNAVPSSPADPANIAWNSGASSVPEDALGGLMKSGLGMSAAEVRALYTFAQSMTPSPQTVTNQQLRLALANAGQLLPLLNAMSSSPSDLANIQWFSGAGSAATTTDALYTLIGTVTSAGSIYTAAAALPSNSPGRGALATAVTLRNVVDWNQVNIISGTDRPTIFWGPWPMFQAYARLSTTGQIGTPRIWTTFPENNYGMFQSIPDQAYGLEMDAITLPDPLVNLTDTDTQILPPNDEVVAYYAAHLCMLFLSQYGPANYYSSDDLSNPGKYERAVRRITATKTPMRMPNIYGSTAYRAQKWYGG